jgi:type I restriction enzyme S subunit
MKFESDDIVFTPITSLLSEVIDNRGRTCPTAEKGIPLIATNCIGNENLYPLKKNIRHVSIETYNTWFRGHPQPGDVIFVNKGTPGRVCLVPDPIDFCIAQDMVSLRVNEHINNLYLLAAIRSPQVQKQIQQMQVGTMIPHFKKGDFEKLLIPMRDMPTQKAIGKIYFELSQKIDVNERTSKTLEDIAQTIFKSWFIDFDPVKAKTTGEKPAGMDAATAALFPDSMEESELGSIPKGWKVEKFGEVNNLLMGQSPPGDTYNSEGEGLPFYQGRTDFGFRFPKQRIFCTQENRVALPGETLISVRAPVGDVNQAIEKCIIGRGVASVLHKSNSGAYTFSLLKSLYPRLAYFNGEGTVFGAINRSDFNGMLIVEPPTLLIERFEVICGPMNAKIRSLFLSTEALIQLRDSLLPRLISGELQIPDEMLAS